ncbi:hypothetical protein ACFIOY_21345 [Bradyrhizobium sp. TZ2]
MAGLGVAFDNKNARHFAGYDRDVAALEFFEVSANLVFVNRHAPRQTAGCVLGGFVAFLLTGLCAGKMNQPRAAYARAAVSIGESVSVADFSSLNGGFFPLRISDSPEAKAANI